ncbi:hypothetical protein HBB16_20625 [Pseudonocardia sp. MCCB 268]|nr:hypothetical protein [Pseudonocardia cytotoxica]
MRGAVGRWSLGAAADRGGRRWGRAQRDGRGRGRGQRSSSWRRGDRCDRRRPRHPGEPLTSATCRPRRRPRPHRRPAPAALPPPPRRLAPFCPGAQQPAPASTPDLATAPTTTSARPPAGRPGRGGQCRTAAGVRGDGARLDSTTAVRRTRRPRRPAGHVLASRRVAVVSTSCAPARGPSRSSSRPSGCAVALAPACRSTRPRTGDQQPGDRRRDARDARPDRDRPDERRSTWAAAGGFRARSS